MLHTSRYRRRALPLGRRGGDADLQKHVRAHASVGRASWNRGGQRNSGSFSTKSAAPSRERNQTPTISSNNFNDNIPKISIQIIILQDFWFAAVHKKLVGDRVLNLRSQANGDPKCSLFAYCTQTGGPENYPTGAVTVMGINMGDVELFGNITNGSDENASRDLHHYLLTGNIDER